MSKEIRNGKFVRVGGRWYPLEFKSGLELLRENQRNMNVIKKDSRPQEGDYYG